MTGIEGILLAAVVAAGQGTTNMTHCRVGDAYTSVGTSGTSWMVGAKAVTIAYAFKDGSLKQTSLRNRLVLPARDYIGKSAAVPAFTIQGKADGWTLESSSTSPISYGGQPAAELTISLRRDSLSATMHVVAFPGSSIIRQWVELKNVGTVAAKASSAPFRIALRPDDAGALNHYWMIGGNSGADHGMMQSAPFTATYHSLLKGQATAALMPWTAFQRGPEGDGWFMELEYLANWKIAVDRDNSGPAVVAAEIPDLEAVTLEPGQSITLPAVTVGVYTGGLDGMARQSYDWQYQYQWDYTNMDYYARPKWAVAWFYCARNIQEQFAERLAYLDMDTDLARAVGFEMLWDDAGWSLHRGWPEDGYGNVFRPNYEGPDFSQTIRYLGKSGMNWLAWFMGRPSPGVMDDKVAAWGDFEWRTDAVEFPDFASDGDLRAKIEHFLDNHPRCSFHTCSGGSRYSHTFGVQRYANTNYFSDFGRGEQTNYYFSYIEPPDKWTDIIECWNTRGRYDPARARGTLTMVPFWGLKVAPEDRESLRKDLEIYRYLLREGVAGRWSYVFHPGVKGDTEYQYCQRTNHDRTKACIIVKHQAPAEVVVFPRQLVPNQNYVVGFDSKKETVTRTGADLTENGIVLKAAPAGELIYLGLPDRPRSGTDKRPPKSPGRVYVRTECNLGHTGVGVYWSAGSDDNWVAYYDVARGGKRIGRVTTGNYFFDHSEGWATNAGYEVRTVDGDGNGSPWTKAVAIGGEPLAWSALGGLFPERGREGWCAEASKDGGTYEPMSFVKPAKTASADEGGTPNQPGGVEGYWEGPGGARVGRAWQQASSESTCVRTWIAPKAGNVRIVGRVMKEWYRQGKGSALRVRIQCNDNVAWPKSGWAAVPLDDLVGLTHDVTLKVANGDAIRFVLDKGSDPENDIVAWMPVLTYQDKAKPESASVVRILCGSKTPYTDASGNVWSADDFFDGGRPLHSEFDVVDPRPTGKDGVLYRGGRQGKAFGYSVPVKPGIYAVRLKFAEPKYESIYRRPFNVSVNGREVLRNFDVCQDVRGFHKGDDRVFHHVVPGADGRIQLRFAAGWDPAQKSEQAMVQAIEILPEARTSVRIDCGATADFVDWNGSIWSLDHGFAGGRTIRSETPVAQASPTPYDQSLYQTARAGKVVTYSIAVPPGVYSVHLMFAELWLKEAGGRPMDVEINGRQVRKAWDPATAAGELNMAADLREDLVTPGKDGRITVRVTATGQNEAILQGIEIR